jgi:hypothetical protein
LAALRRTVMMRIPNAVLAARAVCLARSPKPSRPMVLPCSVGCRGRGRSAVGQYTAHDGWM